MRLYHAERRVLAAARVAARRAARGGGGRAPRPRRMDGEPRAERHRRYRVPPQDRREYARRINDIVRRCMEQTGYELGHVYLRDDDEEFEEEM